MRIKFVKNVISLVNIALVKIRITVLNVTLSQKKNVDNVFLKIIWLHQHKILMNVNWMDNHSMDILLSQWEIVFITLKLVLYLLRRMIEITLLQ